jgi:hypothetical protein
VREGVSEKLDCSKSIGYSNARRLTGPLTQERIQCPGSESLLRKLRLILLRCWRLPLLAQQNVSRRSQRTLFRRDLDLDQESRDAISHSMNNEIASVRVELLSCDAREPLRQAFLAAWVRLNAIGLIALSRLRLLRGLSRRDRCSLHQTHSSLRSLCESW